MLVKKQIVYGKSAKVISQKTFFGKGNGKTVCFSDYFRYKESQRKKHFCLLRWFLPYVGNPLRAICYIPVNPAVPDDVFGPGNYYLN